jgi:hypothetical protein
VTDGFLAGTLKRRLRSEPVVDDSQEALKVEVCACVLSCCRAVRKVGVLCGHGVLSWCVVLVCCVCVCAVVCAVVLSCAVVYYCVLSFVVACTKPTAPTNLCTR